MNKVELIGGLTREPELRFTPSGAAVCNLSIAVNGARYDGQSRQQVVTTTFVTCEAWGSLAEDIVDQEIPKGSEVYVLGELTQTPAEDAKDRKTRVSVKTLTVTRRRAGTRSAAPPPREEPPPEYSQDEEPF